MAARARTELDWQATRIEVEPGRHTAILSPAAVADLMIDLVWGADARAAAEGRSVFSAPSGGTRIGEALTSRALRLFSDPALPGHESAPFLLTTMSHDTASVFDNGLPVAATDWIADGRLAALVSSRASAARTGVPLALAPDNLALDAAGRGTLDDVIARTAEGLLVTCTWYNRMVDPQTHLITGLTRDGVYLVRNGEVVGHVGNFRFNESPVALLDRITDAGVMQATLGREMADYFTRTVMPALVVADFNFSSASEAV
jgi:predicted Zn-dependent protease